MLPAAAWLRSCAVSVVLFLMLYGGALASPIYNQCQNLDTPNVGDLQVNGVIGVPESSLSACANLCTSTVGCIGAVYNGGLCYPKNINVLIAQVTAISTHFYVMNAAFAYGCPTAGNTFISTNYVQCANLDTAGVGDLTPAGTATTSVDDCMSLCSNTASCIGAVYNPNSGLCHPKNSDLLYVPTTTPSASDTFVVPLAYGCPVAGNSFISTLYTSCPNLDTPTTSGNIPGSQVVATLNLCMKLCATTSGCVGAVYVNNNQGCNLKGSLSLTSPVSSLSSAGTFFVTSNYACPAVGGTFSAAVYNQCPNVDNLNVGDIAINGNVGIQEPSISSCMAVCSSVAGCIGAAYKGTTCYPKSSAIVTSPVSAVAAGTDTTFITGYICPPPGASFISTKYVQCANLDTSGVGDLPDAQSEASVDLCMQLCQSTAGCIAGVYQNGVCSPKSNAILGTPTTVLAPDTYFITLGHSCPVPGSAFT